MQGLGVRSIVKSLKVFSIWLGLTRYKRPYTNI